jgi:hypothetical protein
MSPSRGLGRMVRYISEKGEDYPAVMISHNSVGDASLVVLGMPGSPATTLELVHHEPELRNGSWSELEEAENVRKI